MLKTFILLFTNLPYLPAVFSALLLIKVVMFLKHRTSRWRLSHFIHFDEEHIIGSGNPQRQNAKRIQNYLTKLIASVGLITLLYMLIILIVSQG